MNWVASDDLVGLSSTAHTKAVLSKNTESVSLTFDEIFYLDIVFLVRKSNWFPVLVAIALGKTLNAIVRNNGSTVVGWSFP